jgi:hypothetical protein
MSPFRSAPWFLKLLLLGLPILLLLRVAAALQGLAFGFAHPNQSAAFWSLIAFDLLTVLLVVATVYMVWRQRPASRWLLITVFLLVFANSIFQDLVPGSPAIALPRIPADGSRVGYQLGTSVAQAVAAWWAYMCVFSSRALAFFKSNELSAHAPAD